MTLDQPTVRASSPDGRMFRLDLGEDDGYAVGDFVTITAESGGRHLGLIEALDQRPAGGVAAGSMLPGWRAAAAGRPFRTGTAARSDPQELADFYSDAVLGLGSMVSAPDVEVGLVPKRLNRHTFWCGQSGSGKTFALGVPWSRSSCTPGCRSSCSTRTATSCVSPRRVPRRTRPSGTG